MGTNFYWLYENPAREYITDTWSQVYHLRDAAQRFLDNPADEDLLRKAICLTGKPPSPIETTLPTGEVISSDIDDGDPRVHIGKRSAAGWYCWDCKQTLCANGESKIHYGGNHWHEKCPKCGQEKAEERLGDRSSVGLELGFSKPAKISPEGVRTCCSFTWAQDSEEVFRICKDSDEKLVVDEYGREMTGREFVEMLEANCPVQFFTLVGEYFS